MKKIMILFTVLAAVAQVSQAQTLFTYGKYNVDANEFLRAYNKNNTQPVKDRSKAIREYLDLFINSKLKIREAYERKYDTLPHVRSEVNNLHRQIAENYMNDPEVRTRLQNEAFQRSQTDISVAHIFISTRKAGVFDSAGALQKKNEVLRRLQKGEDFGEVARQLSDDTSAKRTGGEIGFITVFTLPYAFENAIYTTPTGKYSSPVTSRSGFHIFKNLGERKAAGKMKAQQILLAIPPGSDEATRKTIATLTDSLYKSILKKSDFGMVATRFSNDYISASNNGIMPDISVGEYDPAFEKIVFSLAKDGEVSKPFLTAHGWHILKRISHKPVVSDPNNSANQQELLGKLMADPRWKASRDFIYKKVQQKPGLKKLSYNEAALTALADSLLDLKPMTETARSISRNTPVFSIGDSVYTVGNWLNYATLYRHKNDGSGSKPYSQVTEEFMQTSMYNYYQNHLEDYNEEFHRQMMEFRDGNIFFEIMQQEIWNKAQNDTIALRDIYEKNPNKYNWQRSADAVIFYFSDEVTAKMVYDEIKIAPASWRKAAGKYAEKIVADSSRFEWDQLSLPAGTQPKAGMVTVPQVNTNDNSASFAYIVNVYTTPTPRSFPDARGLLINDYQYELEKIWIETLKKKYPVLIKQEVLNEISR